MDDATKQALSDFVQKVLAAAQTGVEWTAEQTPLLVQEWLNWQLAESLIWAVTQLMIIFLLVKAAGKITRAIGEYDANSDQYRWSCNTCKTATLTADNNDNIGQWQIIIQMIVAVVASLAFGIPAAYNVMSVVKIYVAPRVVILEKFADLIK